uniref:TGc domain-containing protein n=1 Tax=Meloidogyne hapla TaxID=6305 RepID=A0A1I8C263_MELHA
MKENNYLENLNELLPNCGINENNNKIHFQLAKVLRKRLGFPKEMAFSY